MSQLNDAFKNQEKVLSFKNEEVEELELLLTFKINDSYYSVNFEKVHEIVNYHKYTPYPNESDGHLGIINLRGVIVPIISPFDFNIKNMDLNKIEEESESSHDQMKYVILNTSDGHLIGIIASHVRKIEVEQKIIDTRGNEKIFIHDKQPIRFFKIELLLGEQETEEEAV